MDASIDCDSIQRRLSEVESVLGIELRGYQKQALSSIGEGRNVIIHAPTGAGKTVAIQGAPYLSPHSGIVVVLYPLRALVRDQTRRFQELNLPSVTLYGETPVKDRSAIYDQIAAGSAKILLTTPESFDMNKKLQSVLAGRGVSVLVVDEAHAYEEWADGFRPTYRRAGQVAEKVGVKQFLLCSATLTKKGFDTARETIGRSKWSIVQVPATRPNLVCKDLGYNPDGLLCDIVKGKGLSAPGIVFFTTITCLESTASALEESTGKKILRYHGSMNATQRRDVQNTFMDNDVWVFATKAFGMGIDKENIRNIIHYQLPTSILSYAQEIGRAGRDGDISDCYLTQTETGESARFLLDMSVPSVDRVRVIWEILQNIAGKRSDWFEVDWEIVAHSVNLYPQSVQACVSWLFTGKMLEKKQKQTSWKFTINEDSDAIAIKYKRRTPEILDLLRAEAMADQGPSSFFLSQDILAESIGQMFSNWRAKLRKMHELGIVNIEEPEGGRSSYRFIHNEFRFDQGQEQLENARSSAFERLKAMRSLQTTPANMRRSVIERAIALDVRSFDGIRTIKAEEPSRSSTKPVFVSRPQVSKLDNQDSSDENGAGFGSEFVVPF